MDPSNENSVQEDDASKTPLGASSSARSRSRSPVVSMEDVVTVAPGSEYDTMKRAAARRLIERYFYQLTDGCGNPSCDNEYCASSGEVKNLTPNQAAAQALQLFSQEARLCDRYPNKVSRTLCKQPATATDDLYQHENTKSKHLKIISPNQIKNDPQTLTPDTNPAQSEPKPVSYLTESKLKQIITSCRETDCYAPLIRMLGQVFSNIESLGLSFSKIDASDSALHSPIEAMLERVPGDLSCISKEDVRWIEGEQDKDEDSCIPEDVKPKPNVNLIENLDVESVRRTYTDLLSLPSHAGHEGALVTALGTLAGHIHVEIHVRGPDGKYDDVVRALLIALELPALGTGDFLETALPALCKAAAWLPVRAQAQLAKAWAGPGKKTLNTLLENLHQLVTLIVIATHFHRDFYVQDEAVVTSATKLMRVLYYASMLAGDVEPQRIDHDDEDSTSDEFLGLKSPPSRSIDEFIYPDPLGSELQLHVLECRRPHLAFAEFYNEPLSDAVEMDRDFANWKGESATGSTIERFSFMRYPFILTPATKTLGLYFDNRIRMYSERRISLMHAVAGGQLSAPYLRLRVRRDHIIDDALVELEMVALDNPADLKKQLVVEFADEQGIDEGGVSKEFFQLIVEELFNPDYGMFVTQPDTGLVWFSPSSFETDAQFTLVGIVLGLAIYNNVILAVNFPSVVYRKLLGRRGSFHDLRDLSPVLYSSLCQLLEHDSPDLNDVFMQTFRVARHDVFGNLIHHDLKAQGDQIAVTQENKQEFVDLYSDYLLNESVSRQFRAFRHGWRMVTDESPVRLLFRPEELELLVCGSKDFNMDELELATEYDGGYTTHTAVIRHFWQVVHSLDIHDQRRLLQFATGSDRVPLGGLSKLKLVISRNGPDSDRLPTAHTCFNVLLLPEYENKEKLRDRLVKAISYSKGFGML